ncbi:MAG: hypothetical protein ACK5X3_13125 [Pseudomonadota bacterium]|jgi:hypothetical protein
MTPTTDLQKPFTDEELRDWAKTGGFMQSRVAKRLAARVLELEAENKRLREGLVNIKNLAIKRRNEGGVEYCLHHFEGFARTALKGGEI